MITLSVAESKAEPLVFAEVFRLHFDFVWRSARRLGVRPAALDDVVQEVFLVVHRRLRDFEGRSSLKSWIYGVTALVVRNHRRTLRRKPEAELPVVLEDGETRSPQDVAVRAQAAEALLRFLDTLSDDQREVFVMVELEGESVADAAVNLNINVNTAHGRLRTARAQFEAFVARYRADENRRPHERPTE